MNNFRLYLFIILAIMLCNISLLGQIKDSYDSPNYKLISLAFKIKGNNIDSAFLLWNQAATNIHSRPNEIEEAYLNQVGSYLYRLKSDYKYASYCASKCLTLYKKQKDSLGISIAYLEMGNNFLNQNQLDSSDHYFNKSYEIKKKLKGDDDGLCIVLSNLGTIKDYRGDYLKASEFYVESIKINESKVGNKNMLSDTYHNLSIVLYNIGNIEKAIEYQNKAVAINKEINNLISESMNHVCLSAFYLEKDFTNEAEKHGLISEQQCKKLKYNRGLLYAQTALGDVYFKQQKYAKALQYFDAFLANIDKEGDPYMKAQANHKKAKVLIKTNEIAKAQLLLKEALQSYEKSSTVKELKEVHEDLATCFRVQGEPNDALYYLQKSNIYRDSLFKEEKTKELLNIEAKYQAEAKEALNQKLQADQKLKEATISNQRSALWAGGASLILFGLLSYSLYRQRQNQKSLNKKITSQRDQIQLLNKELNHRVKNNLAFMTSLLEMQGRRTPNEETKQLLQESETRLKTLAIVHANLFKNESDTNININPYLTEIINNLHNLFDLPDKSLTIHSELIDHTIDAEDAMRLGLVVNELITNSVKHAFNDVDNPEIHITTSLNEKGMIVLSYKDNGPGYEIAVGKGLSSDTSLGKKLIELLKQQMEDRVVVVC